VVRFVDCLQVKRVNGLFKCEGFVIQADRQASDGFGVLVVFEAPTKVDLDFQPVLRTRYGENHYCWFPTWQSLQKIQRALDLSDALTRDWLRNGRGWGGVRPYPSLEEFV